MLLLALQLLVGGNRRIRCDPVQEIALRFARMR